MHNVLTELAAWCCNTMSASFCTCMLGVCVYCRWVGLMISQVFIVLLWPSQLFTRMVNGRTVQDSSNCWKLYWFVTCRDSASICNFHPHVDTHSVYTMHPLHTVPCANVKQSIRVYIYSIIQ
jgi:hypothetical protein